MSLSVYFSSSLLIVAIGFSNGVLSEPPTRNSGGWGQNQQQSSSGGYSQPQQSYSQPAGGYGAPAANYNNGAGNGWAQPQQQQQQQPQQASRNNGGGWGQQQAQAQSGGGGWGGQQAQTQQSSGNGWGSGGSDQQQKDQGGNSGWGPQLNFELDTANLKNFNPANLFRSIFGIPRRIISFLRESGLYILLIPLIIILPLMLLAFNAGRLIGGLGWGWSSKRSLTSTVESGIIGYLKSPAWQKVAETLMDEHVFDRIMKSVEEIRQKNW